MVLQVLTLTKHRGLTRCEDEQLHVLPTYVLDSTDELDSVHLLTERIQSGALNVLHAYYQRVSIGTSSSTDTFNINVYTISNSIDSIGSTSIRTSA